MNEIDETIHHLENNSPNLWGTTTAPTPRVATKSVPSSSLPTRFLKSSPWNAPNTHDNTVLFALPGSSVLDTDTDAITPAPSSREYHAKGNAPADVAATADAADDDRKKGMVTREHSDAVFMNKVKDYVLSRNPDVVIMVPVFGAMCNVDFVTSLMNTVSVLKSCGIQVNIEFCKNDSLIARARNNLVAKAMARSTCTHLFFVDSDIVWNPLDVLKLLLADKELIGGVYPKKKYFFEKVLLQPPAVIQSMLDNKRESILKDMTDIDYLKCKLVESNLNYIGGQDRLEIKENICEVRHIANGFMMIQRTVIEKMRTAFPYTKYTDDCGFLSSQNEQNQAYALFDCDVEDGHYLSEDWLFCNRWRNMEQHVYVDVSISLCHIGQEYFHGSILATLI